MLYYLYKNIFFNNTIQEQYSGWESHATVYSSNHRNFERIQDNTLKKQLTAQEPSSTNNTGLLTLHSGEN